MAELRRALVLLMLLAGGARADRPETPILDAERDQLIARVVRGEDVDKSVRRLGELLAARDLVVPTSRAAVERQRAVSDARRSWQDAWQKTADHALAWRCLLSPDPAHPIVDRTNSGRHRADWGKVVRKQSVRLVAKNPLDEGEVATLYEIAGTARHYLVRGERSGLEVREDFVADVGELVLVCAGSDEPLRGLAPPSQSAWSGPFTHAFAGRIGAPPRITQKARWAPIHITDNFFFWAIHDGKWKLPEGARALINAEIAEDLGGGRFDIASDQGHRWRLEVPRGLAHTDALVVGHNAWLIVEQPRFDAGLKRLVLTAVDIEERYVDEAAPIHPASDLKTYR